MQKFSNVNELVNTLQPENPVYCIRPSSIEKSVEFFKNNFPGKVLYAVKTNPQEKIIADLTKLNKDNSVLIINGENITTRSKIKSYFERRNF